MSTLLNEDTIVLEELDFDPTCDCFTREEKCTEAADYQMVCTACGGPCGLVCIAHAVFVRRSQMKVTHLVCGSDGPLRELVDVMPL